jgi:hypothetical protein
MEEKQDVKVEKKGSRDKTLDRAQDQVEYMGYEDRMRHARRGSCRGDCIGEIHALSPPITVVSA